MFFDIQLTLGMLMCRRLFGNVFDRVKYKYGIGNSGKQTVIYGRKWKSPP